MRLSPAWSIREKSEILPNDEANAEVVHLSTLASSTKRTSESRRSSLPVTAAKKLSRSRAKSSSWCGRDDGGRPRIVPEQCPLPKARSWTELSHRKPIDLNPDVTRTDHVKGVALFTQCDDGGTLLH